MDNTLIIFSAKFKSFIAICLLTSFASLLLIKSEALDNIEKRTWDWRAQALAEKTIANPNIKLILIDQPSLEFFAENESIFWPWPRSVYSRVIEFLRIAGAKAVAFDIMFSESSLYGEEEDLIFASSMKDSLPVVAAGALLKSQTKEDSLRLETFLNKQIEFEKLKLKYKLKTGHIYKSATLPIIPILNNSALIGNVSSENDSDGVFRHGFAGNIYKEAAVLSLPFALYEAGRPGSEIVDLPYNQDNQLTLRFSGLKNSFNRYSFASIYTSINRIEQNQEPQVTPLEFKDSYVFVGMSAPGLLDLRPTPINSQAPGVEVNATVLDNLLNRNFITEVSVINNWLIASAFIFISAFSVFYSRSAFFQGLLCICTLIALLLSSFALAFAGYWAQMIAPLLACIMSILLALAEQYRLEGAQSRFIKKAFKYYVSPEVIDKIISNPAILKLGGDKRELSIFFCDIAGFTNISESMDPANLVQFLNKFLSAMTSVILKHGGTVDKYVGDAIVAFWNAPLPIENHALKSVLASIECQELLAKMRPEFQQEFNADVYLRIGLHTGTVSVGNFGSAERFNYTVIGDAANLASRLEGANKLFGTDILFSEATYQSLNDKIETIRLAKIKVVGKDKPIWVYSSNKIFDADQRQDWDTFISAFDSGELQKAQQLLTKLPDIKLTAVYRKFIKDHDSKQAWTGVLQLSEK